MEIASTPNASKKDTSRPVRTGEKTLTLTESIARRE